MYNEFFGFREPPFSIAPDPRYLYLSDRHKEALAHLMYGVRGQGGFIVITGEVGTGKTTVSRCFLDAVPRHVDMALILNPKLSARELLASICDELKIEQLESRTIKQLIDQVNRHLLKSHAEGRHTVLMIDEAQNLSADVLEQLRLLTNLETSEKKLLQIVLLGQPELQDLLAQPSLRQLNQRVTARYHLEALGQSELPAYISYRLSVAGQRQQIFTPGAIKQLYRISGGVPRLINLVCDRALLGAYAENEHEIRPEHIRSAAREVLQRRTTMRSLSFGGDWLRLATVVTSLAAAVVLTLVLVTQNRSDSSAVATNGTPEATSSAERTGGIRPIEIAEPPSTVANKSLLTNRPVDPEPVIETPDLSSDLFVMPESFRQLFSLWGEDYHVADDDNACEFAESVRLSCLYRKGTRLILQQINRPAILELKMEDGLTSYVPVSGLRGTTAQVMTRDGSFDIPFSELERYWYGDFILLWSPPPFMDEEVPPNSRVSERFWVSAQLREIIGKADLSSQRKQQLLASGYEDQLRWYQESRNLTADGIAGVMTLIQINNDLNPAVPRLMQGESARETR